AGPAGRGLQSAVVPGREQHADPARRRRGVPRAHRQHAVPEPQHGAAGDDARRLRHRCFRRPGDGRGDGRRARRSRAGSRTHAARRRGRRKDAQPRDYLAAGRGQHDRDRLMLTGLVAFGLTLIGFAVSPWVWLSAPALLAVGFSQQSFLAVNNTLIQQDVAEEYRGRIVSTLFLSRSMVPLGTMLAGFGTAAFGVQATV